MKHVHALIFKCFVQNIRHLLLDWLKQKYGEDQDINIIFEDLPWNDWNSLVLGTQGKVGTGVAGRNDDNIDPSNSIT